MSIYDRITNYFRKPEPIEQPTEEKIANFANVLPGISNGRLSYITLNDNQAYSTNYIIHKCINILAYNLSKLPLRITKNGEPLPIDFILPECGFDIRQPHPRISLSRLLQECGVYFWYKGEFMSKIDDEIPFSLETINPDLMKIETKEGLTIKSWKYDNGPTIKDECLIYASMLNPDIGNNITDENRKTSLIDVVKNEILNYANGREFNSQFFANFAQLGLTLKDVAGTTSHDDRVAIVNEIDNKLSRGRAWQTRCLPQGLDTADTKNLSMREMEFSQTFKDIRDIILGVYGIPRSVFGITNEVGLSQGTVDVEKRLMWSDTIKPVAHMIQEAFNQTLMKLYFPLYKVEFDYSDIDVLQDNIMNKADIAIKYQGLGYTINETNEKFELGMDEITDLVGDMRFVPQSLVPVDEFIPIEDVKPKSIKNDDKIDKIVKILDVNEQKVRINVSYKRKYNRIKGSIERKISGKLGKFFATQLGKILHLIKENKSVYVDKDINIILSAIQNFLYTEKEVLANIMKPLYENGTLTASKLALDTLGIDKVPMIDDYIVGQMTSKIGNINNYTYKLIRSQIKESIAAGESIPQMSKRIQTVYKFNKSRARTIARTESGMLINRTTNEEYRKEGVEKKMWVGGERSVHKMCDGEVRPYDKQFSNGMMFPLDGTMGPGYNINCRCCLSPIISES